MELKDSGTEEKPNCIVGSSIMLYRRAREGESIEREREREKERERKEIRLQCSLLLLATLFRIGDKYHRWRAGLICLKAMKKKSGQSHLYNGEDSLAQGSCVCCTCLSSAQMALHFDIKVDLKLSSTLIRMVNKYHKWTVGTYIKPHLFESNE